MWRKCSRKSGTEGERKEEQKRDIEGKVRVHSKNSIDAFKMLKTAKVI